MPRTDYSIPVTQRIEADFGHQKVRVGDAAPTDGDWVAGDRVYKRTPVAGDIEGWICVGDGNPGTWKEFGVISL